MERAAMFFEGVEVMLAVIRGALFPTGVIDTDQFVAQGSDRLVVFALWLAFLILIIAFGPRFCFEGAAGIFVKGLPAELGASGMRVLVYRFGGGRRKSGDESHALQMLARSRTFILPSPPRF